MTHTEPAPETLKTPEEESTLPEALGAWRIASLLAEHVGAEVTRADIEQLVAKDHLAACGSYKGWPLYPTGDALALAADLVRQVVDERVAWEEASLPRDEAAARIAWHWRDIRRMGDEGRITVGRDGRYLIADLDRLAAEADGEQRITAQAAADELEIRFPTDWQYVEATGWARPVDTYEQPVGTSGRRTVSVALYRLADIRALRDLPGVDWAAVREVPKGAPSPLREYATAAPARAKVINTFAQGLADRHRVEVWAWYNPYTGGWEMDWERRDGAPTLDQVRSELTDDPAAAGYTDEITLCPRWGQITREARDLLQPDAAVIVDTETTSLDGQAVEVAVRDAASGTILLDTLVRPTEPISRRAYWVHGISDQDVADAPPWEHVLPRLLKATSGRTICAYKADFDRDIILGDTYRVGEPALHLENGAWYCLMRSYAAWLGSRRWLPLGGDHRAAGDCATAREVLLEVARGKGTAFTPRPAAPGDPVPGPPEATTLAVDGERDGPPLGARIIAATVRSG
jgi:DNA polymerase III epsilon subunit-like protein